MAEPGRTRRNQADGGWRSQWSKWKPYASWLLIVAGSLLATWLLLRENLDAKWWIQDDHRIQQCLGPDRKASLGEFGELLASTELRKLGTYPRVRPSYHVLRTLETIAWDDSPRLWYAARMILFAASFVLFWRALSRWIGVVAAGGVILYCLTYGFWGDIFCRLGPGETYCVPGTAMFVLAAAGLLRHTLLEVAPAWKTAAGYWLLLTVGAFVAMGSKESFLLLLLPTLALLVLMIVKKRLGIMGAVCFGLIIAYGTFLITFIVLGLRHTGRDVYMQEAGAGFRVSLIGPGLVQAFRDTVWCNGAAAVILVGALVLCRRHLRKLVRPLVQTAAILLCLLMLYVSQFVFYGGDWPGRTPRYHFPGRLMQPLYWVALVVLAVKILQAAGVKGQVMLAVRVVAIEGLLLLVAFTGFAPLRDYCKANARRSRGFTDTIDKLVQLLRREPDRPLLLVSHTSRDGEPAVSVQRFLASRSVRNPIFLELRWRKPPKYWTQQELRIHRTMARWSRNGEEGFGALGELPSGRRCFAIGLSDDVPTGQHEVLGRLW